MANILFQCITVLYAAIIHPFFVSMTDINFNEKDKELEISVRIFADDFENTLRKYHTTKIDILHPADQQEMNGFVTEYIQKHLQLKVNGQPVQINFAGYEQQSESIWAYFEVKNITSVQKIDVTDSLLYDYSANQVNLVHVRANNKELSYKLDYPNASTSFSF
jgi:undecaprenyl pyrophosphate synthase